MNTKCRVRAGDGLKVFFPLDIKAAPGRRTFVLEGDEVIEVDRTSRFVMRSLRCGDLVMVRTEKAPAAPKPKGKAAKAEGTE
jgi:hypothetical protein